MKKIIFVIAFSCICDFASAQCTTTNEPRSDFVHWSASTISYSPDCNHFVQVTPDTSENENAAIADLISFGSENAGIQLFTVPRNGHLFWDRDGKRLVFYDEFGAVGYKMKLFHVPPLPGELNNSSWLDESLRTAVTTRLASNEEMARFWPELALWLESQLLIIVNVDIATAPTGPFTGRCFGFLVSTDPPYDLLEISRDEYKDIFSAECID